MKLKDLKIIIQENAAFTVTIQDLYPDNEWDDENEAIYHFVDSEILDQKFTVKTMSAEQAKEYTTGNGEYIMDIFEQYAETWQRKLVQNKIKNWDNDRIIVVDGKIVIDGNHQIVAGILANKPIKFIDINQGHK